MFTTWVSSDNTSQIHTIIVYISHTPCPIILSAVHNFGASFIASNLSFLFHVLSRCLEKSCETISRTESQVSRLLASYSAFNTHTAPSRERLAKCACTGMALHHKTESESGLCWGYCIPWTHCSPQSSSEQLPSLRHFQERRGSPHSPPWQLHDEASPCSQRYEL